VCTGDVGDEAGDDRSHPGPGAATRRRDIPEDGGGRQPRPRVVAARRRGGRRSHGTPLLAPLFLDVNYPAFLLSVNYFIMTWTLALNGPLSWVVGYSDYDVFLGK
jgi:hypothetical protein